MVPETENKFHLSVQIFNQMKLFLYFKKVHGVIVMVQKDKIW